MDLFLGILAFVVVLILVLCDVHWTEDRWRD